MSFYNPVFNGFDPLNKDVLGRALDVTLSTIQSNGQPLDGDSDEELEAELRRELIDIVLSNGVNDPETLRDILVAHLQGSPNDNLKD